MFLKFWCESWRQTARPDVCVLADSFFFACLYLVLLLLAFVGFRCVLFCLVL